MSLFSPIAAWLRTCWPAILEVALLVGLFYLLAGTPPPDANEAHYLAKAKHYWNSDWCAGDLFLESADAHLTFYWTLGWLTRPFSLPTVALIGRFVGWTLLACSWRALSRTLAPRFGLGLVAAAVFHLFLARCNLGGEWVIGGVEAKVFAYAFLFWGLAAMVRGQWQAAWIWFGAASAFHVLVGGWAVLVLMGVWLVGGPDRPKLLTQLVPLGMGFLLSLPGLLPALALTGHVNAHTRQQANLLYVYERLPHHLLPSGFEPSAYLRFLALCVTWLILSQEPAVSRGHCLLRRFTLVTLVMATVAVALEWALVGHEATTAAVLRYYWFRLSDVLVPLGVALESVLLWERWRGQHAASAGMAAVAALCLLGMALTPAMLAVSQETWPGADWQSSSLEDLGEWRRTCEWIKGHTPENARVLSPRDHFTFKWYAERPELVNWKDVPQDAAGLLRWWHTQKKVWGTGSRTFAQRWHFSITELGDAEILAVAREFRLQYVIVEESWAVRELPFKQVYPNPERKFPVYRVYELPRD